MEREDKAEKVYVDFIFYQEQRNEDAFIEEKFMDLKFEWDEEKDRINFQKHGISFETASYVFRDEYYIEMYDFEHSMEEDLCKLGNGK